MESKFCRFCGKEFFRDQGGKRNLRDDCWADRIFCSHSCANKRMPPVKRFLTNVKKSNGCWEFLTSKDSHGYGRMKINGKTILAHRLMWELYHEKIPEGLLVCHHCDNPACVRPDHLFLGTHKDNAIDKVSKGRHRNGASGRIK